jgi:hypothetical protein
LAPFDQAVSEEKIFLTLANQKKELILAAMFVGRMEPSHQMELYTLGIINTSVYMFKYNERRILRNDLTNTKK